MCIKLRKICPSRGCWIFRIKVLITGRGIQGAGVETPAGAMLNRTFEI